jgi:predicted metal-dependent hydrolase
MEARSILPDRVRALALQHGLKCGEIRVKNLKSRWGSCSSTNNINLNIHLVRLLHHLRDYVILHKLAHTVYKNHGQTFWMFLEKLSGNAKGMAKEMKNYRTQIF